MADLKTKTPLISEDHPNEYNGYPFITLLQYGNEITYLSVIDNTTSSHIKAYILDLCNAENVNEQFIITECIKWYESYKEKVPLSVYFSSNNLTDIAGRIYKTFNIEYISRAIGPLPYYNMDIPHLIKRKKCKKVHESMILNYIKY